MARRVIKVSKKTLEAFKNSPGINDGLRVTKIEQHCISNEFFISQFLDEDDDEEYIRKSQAEELFGDDEECNHYPDVYIQMYYRESRDPCMNELVWRCRRYSKDWNSVQYNTSSMFAYNMCSFDDDE